MSSVTAASPKTAVSQATEDTTPDSSPPPEADDHGAVSKAMQEEEERMRRAREEEDAARDAEIEKKRRKEVESTGTKETDQKFKALEYLLSQSKLYSSIMLQQIQKQEDDEAARDEKSRKRAAKREQQAEKAAEASQRRATRGTAGKGDDSSARKGNSTELPSRGRPKRNATQGANISSYFKKSDLEAKAGKGSNVADALEEAVAEDADDKKGEDGVTADAVGVDNLHSARQPALVTGGTMRAYQLEGLEWLTSLYENGLNGILADEMGLGKTIQTIAFLAFLREKGTYGPFLIAAPLSTTANWVDEFNLWTPDVPVVLYHGSKQEREQTRKNRFKRPGSETFPVVVTSYEICMNDRKFLAGFGWKFIIIDEGHRIKNLNCRLIRELQSYQSANRLLITGTPLQNNLTELWSLLHFLMPSIFTSLQAFESWFDFSPILRDRAGYESLLDEEKKQKLVTSLHAILKPFLLRRVKRDVEKLLPKKREYVLFAPLTNLQRELYSAILDGTSREYLEGKAAEIFFGRPLPIQDVQNDNNRKRKLLGDLETSTPNKSAKSSRGSTPASSIRGRRGRKKNYEEVSDAAYFRHLESGADTPASADSDAEDTDAGGEDNRRHEALKLAKRLIGTKKLQNPVMQLRLCCDSPFNFYNPFQRPVTARKDAKARENEDDASDDDDDEELPPDESLVTSSGKMLILDALLPDLFKAGHKVLIFSQFKSQLDLIEQYATALRGWGVCRIDGSVSQAERQAQIAAFNAPSAPLKTKKKARNATSPPSPPPKNLFLLSTRAGGQGINLAAADTVVLFDSDWNPQQDAQAQDRAHRIGQTRPVLVYRLATRATVEEALLRKAEGKRRLEKLVIRKGGNVRGTGNAGDGGVRADQGADGDAVSDATLAKLSQGKGLKVGEEDDGVEELRRLLAKDDGQRVDVSSAEGGGVLSARDIAILTDRSEEAFERAEKGLDAGDAFRALEAGSNDMLEGLQR